MLLTWTQRILDRTAKQLKDRHRHLDTSTLDPATRAAVELVVERRTAKTEREILKYRHLFIEGRADVSPEAVKRYRSCKSFCILDYFEDETGKEISLDEIGQILSGVPTARAIPRGAKQDDIDLMFAEAKPKPIAEVSLTDDEVRALAYFRRDLWELVDSAFMRDGPGTLESVGGTVRCPTGSPTLRTAATDDEIRSFVTIFRRLYMAGKHDLAVFVKAVPIFVKALGDHPHGKWAKAALNEYDRHLQAVHDPWLMRACTFTNKQLIDVFLYTQYAHQPDTASQRQFRECLAEVQGKRDVLTWLFLKEIWTLTLEMRRVGKVIVGWFDQYCHHHNVSPDVLHSLRDHHPGLGAAEKQADRNARLFEEKVEEVADSLWDAAGSPPGGPEQFIEEARGQLQQKLQG